MAVLAGRRDELTQALGQIRTMLAGPDAALVPANTIEDGEQMLQEQTDKIDRLAAYMQPRQPLLEPRQSLPRLIEQKQMPEMTLQRS